jgi:hypothetical protein
MPHNFIGRENFSKRTKIGWCNLRWKIQEEFMDVAPRNRVNDGGRKEQRQTKNAKKQKGIVLFEGGWVVGLEGV